MQKTGKNILGLGYSTTHLGKLPPIWWIEYVLTTRTSGKHLIVSFSTFNILLDGICTIDT